MKMLDSKDSEITLTVIKFKLFFHLMCMHLIYLKIYKVWDVSLIIAVERFINVW